MNQHETMQSGLNGRAKTTASLSGYSRTAHHVGDFPADSASVCRTRLGAWNCAVQTERQMVYDA